MGFGDLFKASENSQLKAQIEELQQQNSALQQEIAELRAAMPKEAQDLLDITEEIKRKTKELDELADKKATELQAVIKEKESNIAILTQRHDNLRHETEIAVEKLSALNREIIETDETILLQTFGLYQPQYDFANSSQYKERLDHIRAEEKSMIKDGIAVIGASNWTVNNSQKEGRKLVANMEKLLLRAFNTECDELVRKVKFNNVESFVKRINSSYQTISKLGAAMQISISLVYRDLKIQELYLAHEYALKKQEEKEELKRIRAEQREQAKLEKEIEVARKKLEKEQNHCKNELARMLKQDTSSMNEEEKAAFDAKKSELEAQLGEIQKGIADVDYRAANQKAGYVYVISNIGSFGENIYKIGMTRRLDPMDRVNELGDASVPFNFDVHALIFSEDAPALEAALHKAFEDRKVNMVNTRREFFNVTLEEIKDVIKANFDKTVEFIETAPAEQFRESLLMKKATLAQ